MTASAEQFQLVVELGLGCFIRRQQRLQHDERLGCTVDNVVCPANQHVTKLAFTYQYTTENNQSINQSINTLIPLLPMLQLHMVTISLKTQAQKIQQGTAAVVHNKVK